jgi:hypothetical protein
MKAWPWPSSSAPAADLPENTRAPSEWLWSVARTGGAGIARQHRYHGSTVAVV